MKTTTAALVASLFIHGFVGYSALSKSWTKADDVVEPIEISYVRVEPVRVEEKKIPLATPPKQISLPKVKVAPKKVTPVKAVKKQEMVVLPKASAVPPPQKPKTAVDFVQDPKKSKIFVDYYGTIKEKIHTSLRRRYHPADGAMGVVNLYFVLKADGTLVSVETLKQGSDAALQLQNIAIDSLKKAGPFGSFPEELGQSPLAFNLKIYFDEMS